MKSKSLIVILLAMVFVVFTTGCSLGAPSAPPVVLVAMDQGWDSNNIHTAIARFVVENGFGGYVIEEIRGSAALLWQAMVAGDIDLNIEEWPYNMMAVYRYDIDNGNAIELGVLVEDSAQGLYVPRFVIEGDPERGIAPMAPTLRTVEDLKRYSHVFRDPDRPRRGRIHGAVPGWTMDDILDLKVTYYGLNEYYNYVRSGSEATLFASIEAAYNLGEPWVGACWEPTWIVGKFDLVLLEDAPYEPELFAKGGTEFPKMPLTIVSSAKFPSRAPDLVDFFTRYRTGSRIMSEALTFMHDTRASSEETAVWFLKNNDHLLDEWLEPEQAARVREALSRI